MADYYARLGVPRGASDAAIRLAFRQLAKRLHPDVSGLSASPAANERFRGIVEAHDVLTNPLRRAAYDATLGAARVGESAEGAYWAQDGYARPSQPPAGTSGGRSVRPAWTGVTPSVPVAQPGQPGQPGTARQARQARPAGQSGRPGRPRPDTSSRRATAGGPVGAVAAIGGATSVLHAARAAALHRLQKTQVACAGCGGAVDGPGATICGTCREQYGAFGDHLTRALQR